MRRLIVPLMLLLVICSVKPYEYDVIVVGGGEAGVAAALQARWLGLKVALTEESDYIGGTIAGAGLSTIPGHSAAFPLMGIYKNFTDRIRAHYATLGRNVSGCYWSEETICFEPKVAEMLLTEMLKRDTVVVYKPSYPVAAFLTQDRSTLHKVLFSDGHVLAAKVFIDASEYGDLIEAANVRYRVGNHIFPYVNKEDCVQPLAYTAVIKQYDYLPAYLRFRCPPPDFDIADWNGTVQFNGSSEVGKLPWSWEFFKRYRGLPDSSRPNRSEVTKTVLAVEANEVAMKVTHLDRENRFVLQCYGKLRTLQFLYYIQRYIDQRWSVSLDEKFDTMYNTEHKCPNIPSELRPFEMHLPPIAYIRESRRLLGLYTLSSNATQFADSVGLGTAEKNVPRCFDLEPDLREPYPRASEGSQVFEIPLRVFVPESLDGLLAAGKTLSVSRLVNTATQHPQVSMLTGQTAGIIASLAVLSGKRVREVSATQVQRVLDQFHVVYKLANNNKTIHEE